MAEIKKYTELPPVIPSAAITAAYSKQIRKMVKEMQKSVLYWIIAAYKKAPVLAEDAKDSEEKPRYLKETIMQRRRRLRREKRLKGITTSPKRLQADIDSVMIRWEKKWADFAEEVAKKYWDAVEGQGRFAMEQAFKEHGFTVNLKMTPELKTVMESSVTEQVSLIKTIPRNYHDQITGMVQRSYQNNMDIKTLTKELKDLGHSTDRRAYLIARDQTAKMNDTINRTRCEGLGITHGKWMHRAGGSKSFRSSHVKMDGKIFELAKGCYDDDPKIKRYIHCGELPFCKCVYKPLLPFEMEGIK